jgi:hypothetical protein
MTASSPSEALPRAKRRPAPELLTPQRKSPIELALRCKLSYWRDSCSMTDSTRSKVVPKNILVATIHFDHRTLNQTSRGG